jgi:hypothetical protein
MAAILGYPSWPSYQLKQESLKQTKILFIIDFKECKQTSFFNKTNSGQFSSYSPSSWTKAMVFQQAIVG